MEKRDLVSIIVPVYNSEKTIEKCLHSILNGNSNVDIEVIVINDGSTDNSLTIINEIAKKDTRVKVITQPNTGVGDARNTGLKNVHGNYIMWCDSDDYVDNGWVEQMLHLIKDNNADIACSRVIFDNINTEYNPQEIKIWNKSEAIEKFVEHKIINGCLPTKIFKYDVLKDASCDKSMRYWEDSSLVWDVLKNVRKVVRINDSKYHYTINPDSLCNCKTNVKKIQDTLYIWDKVYNDCLNLDYTKSIIRLAYIKMVNSYISALMMFFKDNVVYQEGENKIQKLLRKDGLKAISAINGHNKIFAILAIVNMRLAKLVIRMLYKIKK